MLSYNVGFGGSFGAGFTYVGYKYTNSYDFSLGGSDYSEDFSANITAIVGNFGYTTNFGPIHFGAFIRAGQNQITTDTEQDDSGDPSAAENDDGGNAIVMLGGVGLAIRTTGSHFELSVTKPIKEEEEEEGEVIGGNDDPVYKANIIAEWRFSSFVIGYNGVYYSGGYTDPEQIVQKQLVYVTEEARMVHGVNIAFGTSKGLSIGGSYSVSSGETEEQVPFVGSGQVTTEVNATTMALKLSYVF